MTAEPSASVDRTHELMLFGLATVVFLVYFLYWRRRALAPRGDAATDSTVRTVVSDHIVELLVILVPFIVLAFLSIVKRDPAQILLDNELALAAAVLCCHKIVAIGSSRYHESNGVTPEFIENCRAGDKKWLIYMIINLVLAVVAISANSLIDASQATLWSAVLRYSVFYSGVAMFLRFGVSHAVTERLMRGIRSDRGPGGSTARSA
jgi:putative copper export protein